MKIKLKNDVVVEISDDITWGQQQELEEMLLSNANISANKQVDFKGSSMIDVKYKLLEMRIEKITKGGELIQFTRDWMNNLSMDDGNKLYDAVDIFSVKKK